MASKFDLLIIGTGTAAYNVAHPCARAGLAVAVVDERAYGGTCARRGCQPKKYLVAAAEVAALSHDLAGLGVKTPASLDWNDLMRQKRRFTEPVPRRTERGFLEAGITTLHGSARFTGPGTVRITGPDTLEVRADHLVIATGSRPRPLPFAGAELITSSEEFLDLDRLPRRLVCVGGGYISLEFAHVAARFGTEVVILQRGPDLLPAFDRDLVSKLATATREQGIELRMEEPVTEISGRAGELVVHTRNGGKYEADMALHGAGRVPVTEGLDLPAAGVAFDDHGILVDEGLRSPGNPAVFAVGDVVAGSPMLAPVADLQGEVAAANIIAGRTVREAAPAAIPSVVFTHPPLASVGMTAEQASR